MADKAFFETNILIYAFSGQDSRQSIALDLLLAGGTVGIQTLNEFVSVAVSKLTKDAMAGCHAVARCKGRTLSAADSYDLRPTPDWTPNRANYGYPIYDSVMLAAALEASCTMYYSEDMQDGQVIGDLRIRNPFRRN